jgi:preprotein translocase subunit YajC
MLKGCWTVVATTQGAQGGGSPLLILVLFSLAFWFLLIAPQRKKQKEQTKMIAMLKSGDSVVTSGGVYVTVVNVKPDRFVVKTVDGSKFEIHRTFIQSRVEKSDHSEEK